MNDLMQKDLDSLSVTNVILGGCLNSTLYFFLIGDTMLWILLAITCLFLLKVSEQTKTEICRNGAFGYMREDVLVMMEVENKEFRKKQ